MGSLYLAFNHAGGDIYGWVGLTEGRMSPAPCSGPARVVCTRDPWSYKEAVECAEDIDSNGLLVERFSVKACLSIQKAP